MKRRNKPPLSVSEKANRLLSGILVVFTIIVFRLWHLAVVEHDVKTEEAYKPQKRTVPLQSDRATVCDRFGTILATNKIQYNVSVSYGGIKEFPVGAWRVDALGNRVRVPVRKEYIGRLSALLAEELHLDRERIEDLIHAKASVLGNIPFLIKANISERSYLRFKMLEKDWPGLHAERVTSRHYPMGKTAADIIGYIGPISSSEYRHVTEELAKLRECLRAFENGEEPAFPKGCSSIDEVSSKLRRLEGNAYDVNTLVGKMGIEAFYDSKLRGAYGRKVYLIDRRGNFIQELPKEGREVVPGRKLRLTISSELQSFADELLLEHERNEMLRSASSLRKQKKLPPLFPWIKGGAIVALDPNNGEVLAMASSPRCDLNDFINLRASSDVEGEEMKSSVCRWLENVSHISELRDFKTPLQRERKDVLKNEPYFEETFLSLKYYLDFVLPEVSLVKKVFCDNATIGRAIDIQSLIEELLAIFSKRGESSSFAILDTIYPSEEGHISSGEVLSLSRQKDLKKIFLDNREQIEALKESLAAFFIELPSNYDKILLTDLFRLCVDPKRFEGFSREYLEEVSLFSFSEMEGRYISLRSAFEKLMEDVFTETFFKKWRGEHFAKMLAQKRAQERVRKQRFPTPYVDYLDVERRELFKEFVSHNMTNLMFSLLTGERRDFSPDIEPFIFVVNSWREEIERGAHTALPWREHYFYLKNCLKDIPAEYVASFLSTFRSFSDLRRPLLGKYPISLLKNECPIEQDLFALCYPTYGFGYLRSHAFRQATTLGSIFKLVSTYSVLFQKVLDEDSGQQDLTKLLVLVDKNSEGFRSKKSHIGFFPDGSPIPNFYRGGILPGNDYSGRGALDLIRALEMSSNPYFSLMVGDFLEDPEDLCAAASLFGFGELSGLDLPGEFSGYIPRDTAYNRSGLYAMAIGQHTLTVTPLQTAVMMATLVNGGKLFVPRLLMGEWGEGEYFPQNSFIRREIFMPEELSSLFKKGMQKVIWGKYGTARSVRDLFPKDFLLRVVGKTSTAESLVRTGLDREHGLMKMKHVWFGAIGFKDEELLSPDIVVVVYLRLGEFGKDAAPMALKMIDKWEKIKASKK
ncbi:penicillin-binding transpeptidase domain-containing protein [Chlamydiifrater phoenicopteri]|uniref:penicillin-binding transpeptidase domain-containing protein n=1 Tax=Chlamydiifrater phoenicopteri TaxID=2681469 RepID=UPI001BCBDE3E|nr:penicillin-binding transpeptidase domain-containing protein [Chlamydiifrater phoenicopteri]